MSGFKLNMSPQLQRTSLKYRKQSLSLSTDENCTLPAGSKRKVHKMFCLPASEERSIFPFNTPTALNYLCILCFICAHHGIRLQWIFSFQNTTVFIPPSVLAVLLEDGYMKCRLWCTAWVTPPGCLFLAMQSLKNRAILTPLQQKPHRTPALALVRLLCILWRQAGRNFYEV